MNTYQKLKNYTRTIIVGTAMAASLSGLASIVAAEDVKKEDPIASRELMYALRKNSRGDILRWEKYKNGSGNRYELTVKIDQGAGNWNFTHLDTIKLTEGECIAASASDLNGDGVNDISLRAGPCNDVEHAHYHPVADYLNDGSGNFTKVAKK